MAASGRIVLVTGGSRGVGRAIALRLARDLPEHVVIGYCTDHDAARATVAELEAAGVGASAVAADLAREEQIEALFADVERRFGRLDVFVSNAARATFRAAAELSARSWQRTLDINARALLLGARHAAGLMREGGHVVAVSSLGASRCAPGYAALGAAKAAIEALVRYLAVELAPRGIHVNAVSGGLLDTPSSRLHPEFERLADEVRRRTPAARLGRPEDLAGVVAFLCGPDAAWVSGQTLVADGGWSIVA